MQRRKAETDRRRRRRRCHSARRARLACLFNFLLKSSLACLLWLSTAFLLLSLPLSLFLSLSPSLPFVLFHFLLLFGSFMAHIAHLIAVHMAYVRSSNTLSYICDATCLIHSRISFQRSFPSLCLSVPSLCLSVCLLVLPPPYLPSSPPCLSMQITFHMLGKFAQSFCSHNQLLLNF